MSNVDQMFIQKTDKAEQSMSCLIILKANGKSSKKYFDLSDPHHVLIPKLMQELKEHKKRDFLLKNETKDSFLKLANKVDHVGVVVRSLKEATDYYSDFFNVPAEKSIEVPDHGVKAAFLQLGDSKLELLEPLSENSPLHSFLEKKGESFHHIALAVTNISKVLMQLKEQGMVLIDEIPRTGASGHLIAFLHPKSTQGVLIELCDKGEGMKL